MMTQIPSVHCHVKLMLGNDRVYTGMTAAAPGPVSFTGLIAKKVGCLLDG